MTNKMRGHRVTSLSIDEPLDMASGEILMKEKPIARSMRFEMEVTPTEGMNTLDQLFAKARAEGRLHPQRVNLSCPHCMHEEDFGQHGTVKEAMIRIDTFLSAHAGCSKKGKNDEHEHGERRGPL